MTRETFPMSQRERDRLVVVRQVKAKTLRLTEAAGRMGVSYRQAKRIWRRYRKDGDWGLAHQSRGQRSNRRLDEVFKNRVLECYSEHYWDFGPTLAAEKLAERHGLVVGRETLRRWLLGARLWHGRRAARLHRRRRERRAHFGELVRMDGSDHAWFEDRGERCCLTHMVDDATGRSMALLSKAETAEAAFTVLGLWIERHGVPEALYVDAKNIYVARRDPTEEEKRAGREPETDFGRACRLLGIELIVARSPEAKGRVERHGGMLQDRLVKDLRLAGISAVASANEFLGPFLEKLDSKFAKAPEAPANYHRRLPEGMRLEDILCWETTRKVARDWTVAYDRRALQIEPGSTAVPRSRVTVRRRLNGSLAVLHAGRGVRFTDPKGWHTNQSVTSPPWGRAGGNP